MGVTIASSSLLLQQVCTPRASIMLYFFILLTDSFLPSPPSPSALQCKVNRVQQFASLLRLYLYIYLYISQCAYLCKNRPAATKQASDSSSSSGTEKTNILLLEEITGWMPCAAIPKVRSKCFGVCHILSHYQWSYSAVASETMCAHFSVWAAFSSGHKVESLETNYIKLVNRGHGTVAQRWHWGAN